MKYIRIYFVFLLFLSFTTLQATTLVDWNLDTVTDPNAPNYVNNAAFTGVASSVATVGDGITVTNLVSGSSSSIYTGLVWSTGNAGTNQLNLQRWDFPVDTNNTTTGNGNGVPNNWLQFTISATSGSFTLQSITLSAWRNGSGAPATWQFQYSTNSGSSWIDFGDAYTDSYYGDSIYRTATFEGAVTASTLLVRFIAVGPNGGTGNLHINGLELDGLTPSQVPEPATAGLAAIGLFGFLAARRWRQAK